MQPCKKRFITSSRFSCIRMFLAPGTSKSLASEADRFFPSFARRFEDKSGVDCRIPSLFLEAIFWELERVWVWLCRLEALAVRAVEAWVRRVIAISGSYQSAKRVIGWAWEEEEVSLVGTGRSVYSGDDPLRESVYFIDFVGYPTL